MLMHYELHEVAEDLGKPSELLFLKKGGTDMKSHLDTEVDEDLWVEGSFRKFATKRDIGGEESPSPVQAGFITIGTSSAPGRVGQLVRLKDDPEWWVIVSFEGGRMKISRDGRSTNCRTIYQEEVIKWKGKKEVAYRLKVLQVRSWRGMISSEARGIV
jgi:hypothetical protein